jgi:hypothetical protein
MTASPALPRPDTALRRAGRELFSILLANTPRWYGDPSYDRQRDPLDQAPPRPRTMDAVLEVFDRLRRTHDPSPLAQRVANTLYADVVLGPVVKSTIIIWYNGALGSTQCSAETYPFLLVWEACRMHPLGLPGHYLGSWGVEPPDPILNPDAADGGTA